ncbi:MAG TPA: DEAD/DEAH box helicase [Gemmatimonadaceae bacterium]|nr:DEAD/DEAH box helicase [Gemmatimonadaceae bacterium]
MTPEQVRRMIARVILGEHGEVNPALGVIMLRPHQRETARRLKSVLRNHGGALLADPVGTGKTFSALAVAASEDDVLIVAPAALRDMWRQSLAAAEVSARFVSHESLSRGETDGAAFILVDEAHRFRNPSTRRYSALAEMSRRSRVLLLSATPVQNSRDDLAAQLALFLGRRAWRMTDDEMASIVVRDHLETHDLPGQVGPIRVELGLEDAGVDALLSLPPPIPARGESVAAALLTFSLVHQWTSSQAALVAALRRRRTRATAFLDALGAGRMPSRGELAAWTHLGDAMQLAFPELVTTVAAPDQDVAQFESAIAAHLGAVQRLLDTLESAQDPDDARAAALRRIRSRHPEERIIAFCHYTETVSALWHRLHRDPGVAALTARGAQVAGGRLSRDDVLAQFQPAAVSPARRIERIDLLLSTDVLSEGLNLQEASVVVHLDLPWNPARLEQRVGRVRRLGSRHRSVTVYAVAPPASAERLLRIDERLREKIRIARRTVGIAGQILPSPFGDVACESGTAEREAAVLQHLRRWMDEPPEQATATGTAAAAVRADEQGFLALIDDGVPRLIVGRRGGIETSATDILNALRQAESRPDPVDEKCLDMARREIERWLELERGSRAVDLSAAASARSRRAALARVSRTMTRVPRYRRSEIATLADAARAVATVPLGEGAERVLEMLVKADLPDEAWLRSIAAFAEVNGRAEPPRRVSPGRLVALLLFQRSPAAPPPAPRDRGHVSPCPARSRE